MSANIYWEPVPKRSRSLDVESKSSFMSALQAAGLGVLNEGDGITLNEANLPTLWGMAAVAATGADKENPYQTIINAIETYKEIRLWAVY